MNRGIEVLKLKLKRSTHARAVSRMASVTAPSVRSDPLRLGAGDRQQPGLPGLQGLEGGSSGAALRLGRV